MARLKLHPTLQKIADLRASLAGTDFPEQIAEVNDMEKKAKLGLALLTLKNNVGVAQLLGEAMQERDTIEDWLIELDPKSLDPVYCVKFVGEIMERQHMRKIWNWFIDMFVNSERDLADVEEAVKAQEENEDPD